MLLRSSLEQSSGKQDDPENAPCKEKCAIKSLEDF
jgi:hypothetical protein